jgi:hypothetical protein
LGRGNSRFPFHLTLISRFRYKANTKYPDEVCEMMAKYEWGDLRRTTKKEFKNLKKKTERKKGKSQGLTIKRGPISVPFN